MSVAKTRFNPIASLHLLRRLSVHSVLCMRGVRKSYEIVRAIYDSLSLGSYVKLYLGTLTIYKSPYLKSSCEELKCFILRLCKELKVTFKDFYVYQAW
jgi:hypothetical protein